MIREHLFKKRAPADPNFRWRGGDVSRIEGISDGVFAITITLLVVSTAAPSSFYDMWQLIKDLPAFIASFILIMMAWHYHFLFFRRFGLEDTKTSIINSAFLFIIMFFAFPLKFLCTFLWYLIIGDSTSELFLVPEGYSFGGLVAPEQANLVNYFQRCSMMYLYGFGLIGVFGLLAMLQYRAYSLREKLELDQLELTMTINAALHHLITVVIAVLSVILLYITGHPGVSGFIYFLMPFSHGIMGWLGGKRITKAKALILLEN
ncbi:TMEM175 family protein [Aliikangiella sp. IMCC44359]|uniref:TMEM175 family protein n=1 Tax=Aliikangiella sp. IMCC44359 TaxID=3459125 RepID=UPI00403AF9CF